MVSYFNQVEAEADESGWVRRFGRLEYMEADDLKTCFGKKLPTLRAQLASLEGRDSRGEAV
jgi:hypothetical protein